jgi:hypothetical protein
VLRIFRVNLLEQILDDLFFMVAGGRVDPAVAVFELKAFVDEQGHVAAVVDDQLRALAALVIQRLVGAPPVLFERLALPRKDRDAGGGDGGGGVILRGEDVAGLAQRTSAPRLAPASQSAPRSGWSCAASR